MKKIVVLTGAGMSAESGISTFRESGGLWEQHRVEDVASPEGWAQNPQLVLDFYNARRQQLKTSQPNAGHLGLVELEKDFELHIITQNIDDLHERAGSKNILHLHGELTKACNANKSIIQEIGYNDIGIGMEIKGLQMRPYIVWFGEAVPAMDEAIRITHKADILIIIGTSLNVYPAASLLHYTPNNCPIYLIDPNEVNAPKGVIHIKKGASEGIKELAKILLAN